LGGTLNLLEVIPRCWTNHRKRTSLHCNRAGKWDNQITMARGRQCATVMLVLLVLLQHYHLKNTHICAEISIQLYAVANIVFATRHFLECQYMRYYL